MRGCLALLLRIEQNRRMFNSLSCMSFDILLVPKQKPSFPSK